MFGDGDVEPSKESAVLLCWEACKLGLPLVLAHKLSLLDFETRKDAAQARAPPCASALPSFALLCSAPQLLHMLVQSSTLEVRWSLVEPRVLFCACIAQLRGVPAQVCGCIFRMDSNADGPGVRFVHENPQILTILFQGCAEGPLFPPMCTHGLPCCCQAAGSKRMQSQLCLCWSTGLLCAGMTTRPSR